MTCPSQVRLLNLGCGSHYHPSWINLDLCPMHPDVIAHDLTMGIPFQDGHFDAVYHSHVLEHLDPTQGQKLIAECFRVLKPGGTLRIAIPDLEQIARLYLVNHQDALDGNVQAKSKYQWMKMELLDQMVRTQSGGMMGPYMAQAADADARFIRSRLGCEFDHCRNASNQNASLQTSTTHRPWRKRLSSRLQKFKVQVARRFVRMVLGRDFASTFEEALFRGEGEIHRWMYDRFSLRELCTQTGFENFATTSATESWISDFESFQLDSENGITRKPDSLFAECRKPIESA